MAVSKPMNRKKTQTTRHRTGKNSAMPRINNATPITERTEISPYRIEEEETNKINVPATINMSIK